MFVGSIFSWPHKNPNAVDPDRCIGRTNGLVEPERLITLLTSQQTFLIPMLGLGMSIKNVGSYGVKVVINKKWSLPDSHIKNGGRSPGYLFVIRRGNAAASSLLV